MDSKARQFPVSKIMFRVIDEGAAGFRNSAPGLNLGFYAARLYSLIRPPRRGWRSIRLR
jgi:hypothetical protein